jgi:predicted nucleic acid-binding protein
MSRELLRVLADPKFRWSTGDLEALFTELLLWCETWAGSLEACPQRVGDRHDQVALDLAVSVKAAVLLSDAADLMGWQDPLNPLLILDPAAFPAWLPPIG